MIKLLIYYISHMRNFEQIVNTIHKCFHVFIHDRGAYKHKNTRIVSLPLCFFGKNTKDNHLSTLNVAICRRPVI